MRILLVFMVFIGVYGQTSGYFYTKIKRYVPLERGLFLKDGKFYYFESCRNHNMYERGNYSIIDSMIVLTFLKLRHEKGLNHVFNKTDTLLISSIKNDSLIVSGFCEICYDNVFLKERYKFQKRLIRQSNLYQKFYDGKRATRPRRLTYKFKKKNCISICEDKYYN